jgi:hypothetical protein
MVKYLQETIRVQAACLLSMCVRAHVSSRFEVRCPLLLTFASA